MPRLLLLLGFVLACLAPSAASAQDPRERFEAGVRHFQNGEFTQALDAFRDAYRLRPHPSVLVNIANCYMELDRPLEAAASFERYLREIGDTLDPAARSQIEQALGRARVTIATVEVDAPRGTRVYFDGDQIGVVPLPRPIEANPGPHVIELRLPDGTVRNQRVRIAAGQAFTFRGTEPEPTPTPEPEPEPVTPPPEEPPDPLGTPEPTPAPAPTVEPVDDGDEDGARVPVLTWVSGGVAVGALAAGIGFGISAIRQKNNFEDVVDQLREIGPSHPDYAALQDHGREVHQARRANAIVSDVMLLLAAGGTAIALWALFTRGGDEEAPRARAGGGVARGGGVLVVEGSF